MSDQRESVEEVARAFCEYWLPPHQNRPNVQPIVLTAWAARFSSALEREKETAQDAIENAVLTEAEYNAGRDALSRWGLLGSKEIDPSHSRAAAGAVWRDIAMLRAGHVSGDPSPVVTPGPGIAEVEALRRNLEALPETPMPQEAPECEAMDRGWHCTLDAGHTGEHRATAGAEVIHTWPARGRTAEEETMTHPAAAVYAFAAWLTGRREETTFGATYDCAPIADLVKTFCDSQGWGSPPEGWDKTLKPYPTEAEPPQMPCPCAPDLYHVRGAVHWCKYAPKPVIVPCEAEPSPVSGAAQEASQETESRYDSFGAVIGCNCTECTLKRHPAAPESEKGVGDVSASTGGRSRLSESSDPLTPTPSEPSPVSGASSGSGTSEGSKEFVRQWSLPARITRKGKTVELQHRATFHDADDPCPACEILNLRAAVASAERAAREAEARAAGAQDDWQKVAAWNNEKVRENEALRAKLQEAETQRERAIAARNELIDKVARVQELVR